MQIGFCFRCDYGDGRLRHEMLGDDCYECCYGLVIVIVIVSVSVIGCGNFCGRLRLRIGRDLGCGFVMLVVCRPLCVLDLTRK
jgi:hypothetical protein